MVDLAVPRDIEPEVKKLGDVYLYTVDDLAGVVQTSQASRQAAVAQAEAIVDAGVQSFMHWLDQRHTVPLISYFIYLKRIKLFYHVAVFTTIFAALSSTPVPRPDRWPRTPHRHQSPRAVPRTYHANNTTLETIKMTLNLS